jgi:hypothetical protein
LVKTRRQGRQVFCSLNRPSFALYQDRLNDVLADAATDEGVSTRDEQRVVSQLPPLSARG